MSGDAWRKQSAHIPSGSTPGRGEAEYGGLSLRSAIGCYTVISVWSAPEESHAQHSAFQPQHAVDTAAENIPHRYKCWANSERRWRPRIRGRKEIQTPCCCCLLTHSPSPDNLLLFLNSLHVFLLHGAIHSSGADVGLPSTRVGGCGGSVTSKQTPQSISAPTCGIENVHEWTELVSAWAVDSFWFWLWLSGCGVIYT